jgi:general secretion pathway protein D
MAGVAALASGCSTMKAPGVPAPLAYDRGATAANDATLIEAEALDKPTETQITPALTTPTGRLTAEPFASGAPPKLTGDAISVTFDGIPLPTFVNAVFGELLKVSFEIEDAVAKREQLVTMRTVEPMNPNSFYDLVSAVLQNYGISVVYQNNIYRVIESANRRQDLPRIIASRAVKTVPDDMRPIFQFVQLKNVQTANLMIWLTMALKDRVQLQAVGPVNGVLIMGKQEDVNAALETIEVLDQPYMAGAQSMRITPIYWSAPKLAEQLIQVLVAEGYAAGRGSDGTNAIKLVDVPSLNTIIVFAAARETMQHVLAWAKELDQPGQTVNAQSVFYYQVQNSSAEKLVQVLSGLSSNTPGPGSPLGAQQRGPGMNTLAAVPAGTAPGAPGEQLTATTLAGGGKVIVDAARNAIIFQGSAEEYSQFRALAEQMDRAPLEVLIEATIAEVTLNEGEDLSVALTFNDAATPAINASSIRSDKGLLVSLIRDRGDFLSNLNASANKNRVSILSSPRVVASSGQSASIQVGTQVPIITTQQTSPVGTVGGNSTLLQDVQYRSTGVLLNIEPSINSNRRVELTVSQEVSEAQANKISTVQSPAIFTRSIQTSLSLNDGQTVLLGGLISENFSDGDNGVPVLKDIPLLGNLFKTQSRGRTRIELIVLLTPYIIDSPETAGQIRDAFKAQMSELPAMMTLTPVGSDAPTP